MQLTTSSNTHYLVIGRISLVKKMLINLIDQRSIDVASDGYPFGQDDSDSAPQDITPDTLISTFRDQIRFQERRKIEMLLQDRSCESNCCIN